MLRERDLKMINHIQKYGFLTINQAYKIFFTDRRCGYDLARRRLAKLVEQGHIKSNMDYLSSSEKIFYLVDKYMQPSKHTILIMDTYAELVALCGGVEKEDNNKGVLEFEREQEWKSIKRRSDGYGIFIMGEYLYEIFIEVIYHIGTDRKTRVEDMSKKYEEIIKYNVSKPLVNETLKREDDIPTNKIILIVSYNPYKNEINIDDNLAKIVNVDYSLKGIGNILT